MHYTHSRLSRTLNTYFRCSGDSLNNYLRHTGRLICLIICLATLNACSVFETQPRLPDSDKHYDWASVEPQLRELTHWSLFGKLGVRTPEESITIAINKWDQAEDQFEIDLSSTFFGLGSSKLFGTSDFLSIFQSGEQPLSSFEPDKLVEEALGIPLPLSYLSSWIKALPVENLTYTQKVNEQGLPEVMVQDNWTLTFSHYRTDYDPPLPGKIKLENKRIRMILAVKEWTLP